MYLPDACGVQCGTSAWANPRQGDVSCLLLYNLHRHVRMADCKQFTAHAWQEMQGLNSQNTCNVLTDMSV